MATNKQYFPTMKVPDIVQCLDALDIRISESDLQKPQPNTILRLFETLADLLMNIQFGRYPGHLGEDGVIDRLLEDTTDYPELHRDSFSMMMFFRQVSRVMLNIGVRNFCLKDLTHPEPGRIRTLLSAIINFARFREERLALFEELTAQTDELVKVKNHNLEKRDSMNEQINSIQLQRSEEQPIVDKLNVQTKALSDDLKELKLKGDNINADVSKMKSEKSKLQEDLQNTDLVLQNIKQEATRLRSRIVKNPEQLKRSIRDMHVSLQSLKSTVTSAERQSRDIQMKAENLSSIEQDLHACISLLEECEVEYKNLELTKQRVFAEKEMVERNQASYREMQVKEHQLKRQEVVSEEKLARLLNQLSTKQESAMTKLRKYRKEWEDLSAEGTMAQKQIDDFTENIAILKEKINDLKIIGDTESSSAQNSVTQLKNLLSSQMSDFKYVMNEVDQLM